jgi:hypothetical protein
VANATNVGVSFSMLLVEILRQRERMLPIKVYKYKFLTNVLKHTFGVRIQKLHCWLKYKLKLPSGKVQTLSS